MTTDKAKRKNTIRSRRIIWATMLIIGLIFSGLIALPYAEKRLNQWLENDPFTPMCDAGHLELVYDSDEDGGWVRLYIMRGDGTDKSVLTESHSGIAGHWLFLSPDGRWLTFNYVDNFGVAEALYSLIDLESGEYILNMSPDYVWSSPDARFLVNYIATNFQPSEPLEFGIMYPQQPDTVVYSGVFANRAYVVYWSWDSRFIYSRLLDRDSQIVDSIVVYPDEDFREELLYNGLIESFGWSPNGQYFLFTADDAQWIAEFDETTGHLSKVRQIANHSIDNMKWSPDSTKIAYMVGNQAVVQNVETGEIVWQFSATRLYDWSANGLIIGTSDPMYPYTPESEIVELRIADIDTQTISGYFARSTEKSFVIVQWTPDGQKIFYTFNDEDFYLTPPEPDPNSENAFPIPTSHINYEYRAMWTPDNRYLTYEGDNHWLYLLDIETYESCRVTKGNTLYPTNYDWRLIPEDER